MELEVTTKISMCQMFVVIPEGDALTLMPFLGVVGAVLEEVTTTER